MRRLYPAIAIVVILVMGALALWQFLLKPTPPAEEKADPKKIESQLLAQLEAQKQATEQAQRAAEEAKREAALQAQKQDAEESLRREQGERNRLEQERKRLDAEKRAIDKEKRQAADEMARVDQDRRKIEIEKRALEEAKQEERKRLEEEKKQLESKKQAAEVTKYDGTYNGHFCYPVPNKPPFCWPVELVVRDGKAEGSWVSPAGKGKMAWARGTVATDGLVRLNVETWDQSGSPAKASLTGPIVEGAITALGQWSTGGRITGDWKRTQVATAAPAAKVAPASIASHDGTYSGQLCNKFPDKAPFCWPVALAVRNGVAEGTWKGSAGKTARVRGTVAPDGAIMLNLDGWASSGDPVKAAVIGRAVDGTITASGQWVKGPVVSGEWTRKP